MIISKRYHGDHESRRTVTGILQDHLVRLLSDLIAVESVNPGFPGGGSGEARVAEYVAAWARSRRLEARRQPVLAGRDNLIVTLPGRATGGPLLLEAHMDTAPIGDWPRALTPRMEGRRLYGRGACDTKGSLVAMMVAMERLQEGRSAHPTVILAATVDEETTFRGVAALAAEGPTAAAAIVGEPTRLQPVIAHKGCVRFQIRTVGRAAHSSRPEEGANAILHMATVLGELEKGLAPLLGAPHPLCGSATCTVTMIDGGVGINVVPPACVASLDWRTLPGMDTARVFAVVDAALREIGHRHPAIAVVRGATLLEDAPLETAVDAPVVRAALAACHVAGHQARPRGAPYGSDASKLAAAGIPTLVLGPGDIADAHTAAEHVRIPDLALAVEIYAGIAIQLAS
jgi:acetylornithine deacetylase